MPEEPSTQDQKPRLASLAISWPTALAAFFIPVAIGLGSYYADVVAVYKTHVQPLDPWNVGESPWRAPISVVLLIYTAAMFIKQWGYYFRPGQGKAGFFTDTCGSFNDAEIALDIVLSLWGGVLVLTAWGMPSLWLLSASAYFFLVFVRCRVTLGRARAAAHWRSVGEAAGPNYVTVWSTFPRAHIVAAAKSARLLEPETANTWETRLSVLRDSLDWEHRTALLALPDGSTRKLKAKEILAGWDWVDRMYATLMLVFALVGWVVLKWVGTGIVSFLTTALLGGTVFVMFLFLGDASKAYGVSNWHRIVDA